MSVSSQWSTSNPPGGASGGATAFVRLAQVIPLTPDPDADPDPDTVNAPIGNEYTMYGGPVPFAIPCRISVIGGDAGTLEWLSQTAGSDWALSRPPPNPLPRSFNLHDSTGAYPTYYTDYQDDPEYPLGSGLGYSQLNGLPASNGDFGKRDVGHYLGSLIAIAKIEVFYDANSSMHPPGGPPGYTHSHWFWGPNDGSLWGSSHEPVPTPNWFYYYSQVAPPPFGIPIHYRPGNGSGWFEGGDHVHIGDEAHGAGEGPATDLFAYVNGQVTWVGGEHPRGIDLFVRVVKHECLHYRLWQMIQEEPNGNADGDDDGVPDWMELQVGLDPNTPQSGAIEDWREANEATANYGSNPDNEVFARLYERGLLGPSEQDWASNGLNAGRTPRNYDERVHPHIVLPHGNLPPSQRPWVDPPAVV